MPNEELYPTWAQEREACWQAVRAVDWITHDDLPLAISQALEALTQRVATLEAERDDWRDRFGVRAPEGILSPAESHAFTMRGIEACYAAREKAEGERDALKAALACEPLAWIMAELLKAEGKFPTFPTDPIHAATVVSEESGELAQAALQWVYEGGSREAMRKEAIQTGAMALRFLLHEPTMRQQPCEQLPRPALSPRGEGKTAETTPESWAVRPEQCPHCGSADVHRMEARTFVCGGCLRSVKPGGGDGSEGAGR